MLSTNKMLKTLVEICNANHVDLLKATLLHLHIRNYPYEDLVIQKAGQFINVLHLTDGDRQPDPLMVFFLEKDDDGEYSLLIPIGEQLLWPGGYRIRANFNDDRTEILEIAKNINDTVRFANQWAENLKQQKYHKAEAWQMFNDPEDFAVLIKPDGHIQSVMRESGSEFFTLQDMYKAIECEIVEHIPAMTNIGTTYSFWGDEEAKLRSGWEGNWLATWLAQMQPYDLFAGNVLIIPEKLLEK